MKLNSARIISALVMSTLLAWYIHHDYMKWNRLGREAFYAFQVRRFDHSMASPRPIAVTLLGAIIVVFPFLGIYELVALCLSKVFRDEATIKQSAQP
jgi:hypothetical protein